MNPQSEVPITSSGISDDSTRKLSQNHRGPFVTGVEQHSKTSGDLPSGNVLPVTSSRPPSRILGSEQLSPTRNRSREYAVRGRLPQICQSVDELIPHLVRHTELLYGWRAQRTEFEKELAEIMDKVVSAKSAQLKGIKDNKMKKLRDLGKQYDLASEQLDQHASTGLALCKRFLHPFELASEPSESYRADSEFDSNLETDHLFSGDDGLKAELRQYQLNLRQVEDDLADVVRELRKKAERRVQRGRLDRPPEEGVAAETTALEERRGVLTVGIETLQQHISRIEELLPPGD